MDSGEGNAKIPIDAKNTIKDNAQAGIPAKRDFFISFFIIICLGFNAYVARSALVIPKFGFWYLFW